MSCRQGRSCRRFARWPRPWASRPNTVARAYRELEHSGVVSTRGRNGTVVNGDGSDRAAKEAAAGVRRRDARRSASGRMRHSSWYDVRSTGP